jgi:hypothetical protein
VPWSIRTLGSGVHDNLGDHAKNKVLAKAPSEAEAGPVMSILHDLQAVTVEVNLIIKVHLAKRLEGDLVLAMVFGTVRLLLEGEVVFDGTAGVLGLLILARGQGRHGNPESSEDGDAGEESEEEGGFKTTSDLPGQP